MKTIAALLFVCACAYGQVASGGLTIQPNGLIDASQGALYVPAGNSDPATCPAKGLFLNTFSSQHLLKECNSTNTWTTIGSAQNCSVASNGSNVFKLNVPCSIKIGTATTAATLGANATFTISGGSGIVYFWLTSGGVFVAASNLFGTCNANCTYVNSTSPPTDAYVIGLANVDLGSITLLQQLAVQASYQPLAAGTNTTIDYSFNGVGTIAGVTNPTISDFSNATHTHANTANGGQIAENALALTDVNTGNTATGQHGFAPKLDNVSTHYLSGVGTWTTPAGGGGGGATAANQLTDYACARTSNTVITCTFPSGGTNVGVGNVPYTFTTTQTLTLGASSCAASGHVWIYIDTSGVAKVDVNGSVTSANLTLNNITLGNTAASGFPTDANMMWDATCGNTAANQWDTSTPSDRRRVFTSAPVLAGSGLTASVTSGVKTLAFDQTAALNFVASLLKLVPTSSAPSCSVSGDLGNVWFDGTSGVTTHLKVCANVASSPAFVTVF